MVEALIAKVVSLALLVIGLSHALQPRRWTAGFEHVFRSGHAPFIIGLYTFPIGLLIALGHPVWELRPTVLVTIFGWLLLIKSVLYLVFPGVARAVTPATFEGGHRKFFLVGVAMVVLGGVIGADVLGLV